METFTGTYEHNLDSKNRFFVPADFKNLIKGKITIRLNLSDHPHIDCFQEEDFENVVAFEIENGDEEYSKDELDSISRAYAKSLRRCRA